MAMAVAREFAKCSRLAAEAIKRLFAGQPCRMEKLVPVEEEETDKALLRRVRQSDRM